MTNKLIGGLIAVVIGLALLPVVNDFVTDLTGSGGTFENSSIGTLIDLIPVLYVIIIVAGVAAYVVTSRR